MLLIGEFGDASNDPPVSVHGVDDLLSDATLLGTLLGDAGLVDRGVLVNFRGTHTDVIPLDTGLSIVLAEVLLESEWAIKTRGTACPVGIQQVVRVTWALSRDCKTWGRLER